MSSDTEAKPAGAGNVWCGDAIQSCDFTATFHCTEGLALKYKSLPWEQEDLSYDKLSSVCLIFILF